VKIGKRSTKRGMSKASRWARLGPRCAVLGSNDGRGWACRQNESLGTQRDGPPGGGREDPGEKWQSVRWLWLTVKSTRRFDTFRTELASIAGNTG
jgi:hypothetical protein